MMCGKSLRLQHCGSNISFGVFRSLLLVFVITFGVLSLSAQESSSDSKNGRVTGTVTDIPLLLKFEDFSTAMLASLDAGGGDLRVSSGITGTGSQLALDIVSFTKSSGGIQVWVTVPSVASSTLIYIWGDNTGDTQPAVTDTYGRNAVWVDSETRLHLESNTSGSVD